MQRNRIRPREWHLGRTRCSAAVLTPAELQSETEGRMLSRAAPPPKDIARRGNTNNVCFSMLDLFFLRGYMVHTSEKAGMHGAYPSPTPATMALQAEQVPSPMRRWSDCPYSSHKP